MIMNNEKNQIKTYKMLLRLIRFKKIYYQNYKYTVKMRILIIKKQFIKIFCLKIHNFLNLNMITFLIIYNFFHFNSFIIYKNFQKIHKINFSKVKNLIYKINILNYTKI